MINVPRDFCHKVFPKFIHVFHLQGVYAHDSDYRLRLSSSKSVIRFLSVLPLFSIAFDFEETKDNLIFKERQHYTIIL